jgi:succinyl-CoA synthetase beta subunit
MRLFEYQGKKLIQNCGICIPHGSLINRSGGMDDLALTFPLVMKVQTLGPSRAKYGGVRTCHSLQEAQDFLTEHLDKEFCGETVKSILIEEWIPFDSECYFALRINPLLLCIDFIFARNGGSGIESKTRNDPGLLKIFHFDPRKQLFLYETNDIAKEIGFSGDLLVQVSQLIFDMYSGFRKYDAKLIEINPVVITENNRVYALDAIVQLDDDASFRQELEPIIGPSTEDKPRASTEREERALMIDKEDYRGAVHYIDLDENGDIGLLSVGSGFSITVMDILNNYGLQPANFCDCSGNPSKEKVANAARLILGIPNIKAFLFISGMVSQPLDISAEGLVIAVKEMNPSIPIYVRFAGNQEEEAIRILKSAGFINVFSRRDSVEDVILSVKAGLEKEKSIV